MSRLLFRLWALAVGSFVLATLTTDLVSQVVVSEQQLTEIEAAMAPGFLLAAGELAKRSPAERQSQIEAFEQLFDREVQIVAASELPPLPSYMFADGRTLAWSVRPEGDYAWVLLPDGTEALRVGPYPRWVWPHVPVRAALFVGAGAVFALGFWLVLRPFDREQRSLERAARAIAGGGLDARVNGRSSVAAAFNLMADRTGELLAAQQRLLRAVSHELRTPIARLRIGIHMLAVGQSSDREARAEALDADLEELDDLVEELLHFGRLEATELNRVPVSVLAVVTELARDCDGVERGAGLDGVLVHADPRQLRRVLRNLITNGLRHGGGQVRVDALTTQTHTSIAVEDHGPGIPTDQREQVFEPFVRLDPEATDGFGMGLAIVRHAVQRHGGWVEISESEGGGCRVETLWPNESPGP